MLGGLEARLGPGQDCWQGEHSPSQGTRGRGPSPLSPSLAPDRGWPPSLPSPAPSQVVVIRQERAGQTSVSLLWQEPEQPNGIILEYEVKYYEKVPAGKGGRGREVGRRTLS